jgi:hexosaminidase
MIPSRSSLRAVLAFGCGAALTACRPATRPGPAPQLVFSSPRLVPAPASLTRLGSQPFVLAESTVVVVDPGNAEVARVGELLAAVLRPSTGFALPVTGENVSSSRRIVLRLASDRAALGNEGYELQVSPDSVRIRAPHPAGLFRGVQTLRQLLPPAIESHMKISSISWTVPAVAITDQPRFAWRGAMLDVARHFFSVDEVKQYIDLLALYKLNVLHLHLSDDQGWRIEIKSRPKLTAMGSASEVGGGPGGFYTQADYTDLVRYAQDRYITIVPEIDMPGHTNAALVAHPDVSCSKRPTAIYTGTDVGWSTFCVEKPETYALVDDIVREIAAITPGSYFHMGGDEVEALTDSAYSSFVVRVEEIVAKHGKQMVGWEEINKARLRPSTLVQLWRGDSLHTTLQPGAKLLLSTAKKMYIDMKYTPTTELGLTWAAIIEVRDAYDWDPGAYAKGVSERDIIGMEAPLWSETIRSITAAEFLAVPRLPTLAEVAWTPQAGRVWSDFRVRLAGQAPRWNFLGINYYRSPQIPW